MGLEIERNVRFTVRCALLGMTVRANLDPEAFAQVRKPLGTDHVHRLIKIEHQPDLARTEMLDRQDRRRKRLREVAASDAPADAPPFGRQVPDGHVHRVPVPKAMETGDPLKHFGVADRCAVSCQGLAQAFDLGLRFDECWRLRRYTRPFLPD